MNCPIMKGHKYEIITFKIYIDTTTASYCSKRLNVAVSIQNYNKNEVKA